MSKNNNKQLKKIHSRYYDPHAPKFRYERDAFGFTRKTSRVRKGDELNLLEESVPSFSKRPGSKFPWTKPMIGWRRVYVGEGRWIHKGRHAKTKKPEGLAKVTRPSKFKFIKLPSTYGVVTYGKK